MFALNDKTALVTGAGRGIGKAIALAFADAGADVICISRKPANAEEIAAQIQAKGRKAWPFAVDVADSIAVDAAVASAIKEAGKVDFLVNNAGITRDGLLMRMSNEDWSGVLDTNLKGAFHFIRALSRPFIRQKSGCILNIASVIGLMGNAGQVNYAASKAGLIGLTKSVARELAPRGITVNAIAPGFIETDMTSDLDEKTRTAVLEKIPLKRFGTGKDIAEAALFLVGPGGKYITGQVLVVDGGMVM